MKIEQEKTDPIICEALPFTIAQGSQVWSKALNRHVTETYYLRKQHKTFSGMADLFAALTNHDIELPANADKEARSLVKASVPYWILGGLKSGGSIAPIPFLKTDEERDRQYKELTAYRRASGGIAPCNLLPFDLDALPRTVYARLVKTVLQTYSAVAYETPSHTKEAPRLRIIIEADGMVEPEDKRHCCIALEHELAGLLGATPGTTPGEWLVDGQVLKFDRSVYTDNQVIYLPAANAKKYHLKGEPVSVDGLIVREIPAGEDIKTRKKQSPEARETYIGMQLPPDPLGEWLIRSPYFISMRGNKVFFKPHWYGENEPFNPSSICYLWAGTNEYENGHFSSLHDRDGSFTRDDWVRELGYVADEFDVLPPLGIPPVSGTPEKAFLGWDEVAIEYPPGFVGEIVRQIGRTAKRALPLAAVAAALELTATAMGLGKRRTIGDSKISLISFVIAETAAGKEAGQAFAGEVLSVIKRGRHVASDLRSDKDLIWSLFFNRGVNLFVMDEAHAFIDTVNHKQASAYHRQLAGLMLSMATCNRYNLANNHRRAIKSELSSMAKEINAQRKALTAANEANEIDDMKYVELMGKLDNETTEILVLEDWAENGIPSPVANFLLSSTPRKFEAAITAGEIDSGLMGRSLVFYIGEGREVFNRMAITFSTIDPGISAVVNGIADICKTENAPGWVIEEEAKLMLEQIYHYLEDDERRNAPMLGGLFARGIERVNSLVSILGARDGVITAEYVRWAFACFMSSVKSIQHLARMNNAVSVEQKVMISIMNRLEKGKMADSELKRALKKKGEFAEAEDIARIGGFESPILKAIKNLIENKRIRCVGRNSYELIR